jgi:transcription elongation factor Elf1
MDFRAGIGSLACRLCAAAFQMPIHHLNEPIDVFSEWLDDCEAAANGRQPNSAEPSAGGGGGAAAAPRYDSEDDDDDDIPASSGLKTNKTASAAKGGANNNNGKEKEGARPSYTDLGLDDSDDDSDDD